MEFNGVKKTYLKTSRKKNRPPWMPIHREFISVTGYPGAYLSNTQKQIRTISVPVLLLADDLSDLQKVKEDLAKWLIHDEPKELIFSDDPDRIYYAVVSGSLDLDELVHSGQGIITFLCPDPFKYGQEKTLHFPSDQVVVNNEGTAEADPIFELTATQKTTFAMVSNGDDEYNLIGQPAEEETVIAEEKELIYKDSGEKINEWTKGAISIDDINNQIVAGTMGTDGLGFIATDYGSHTHGHGPAIHRELPESLQDFEVETIFEVRNNTANENFRTEIYLFDESVNMLSKFGINDNSVHSHVRRGHGRIGEVVHSSNPRYVISAHDYEHRGLRLTQFFMRMSRIGNLFSYYIAQIDNKGRHIKTMNKSVYLNDPNYLGRLKFIQLYIRTLDNRYLDLARINFVRVYKRNVSTVDQTPYILYPGDVVTFDHEAEDILVNGEVRPDLFTTMGADFFKLKEGYNNLVVTPANSFETKMKYQERFR